MVPVEPIMEEREKEEGREKKEKGEKRREEKEKEYCNKAFNGPTYSPQ
jgi:hypothetical protein